MTTQRLQGAGLWVSALGQLKLLQNSAASDNVLSIWLSCAFDTAGEVSKARAASSTSGKPSAPRPHAVKCDS